jgi:SOS-response transcriptional repressor LexA
LGYPAPMGRKKLYEVLSGALDDGGARAVRPGEFLLVEEDPALEDGGLYLVETPGGLHLREARWEGAWRLVPWDPAYPPFPLEAVRVVARVRGVVQYDPLG